MSEKMISEEQVLHNELSFEINQELIHLMKRIVEIQQENQQLKEKINTYENPEDLTLMFMYCDEKAKDKIKQLKEVIEEARENINELIEHYKRLLNAEYNQEISVFVDKTHKNMFISNVVSSLEVMKICILDKAGDNNE